MVILALELIKHHTMKGEIALSFLALVVDSGEWSVELIKHHTMNGDIVLSYLILVVDSGE